MKNIAETNWFKNTYIFCLWGVGFMVAISSLLYLRFSEMVIEYIKPTSQDATLLWTAGLVFAFATFVLFRAFEEAYVHMRRRKRNENM